MISIVIPLYNKAEHIGNTLASVLNQTYKDYEIVVVDDGSTDGSAEIVKELVIPCVRLIVQQNAGVSAARNRGINEARGEFVAFLDADDEWKPDYLSTQIQLVKKFPLCDVFATNYEFCNQQGETKKSILHKLPFQEQCGELTNYFEVASSSHPPLWTSAVMVRKSVIQSIGGFPEGIKSGEDLLTWARLAVRYKIAYCKKSLATFIFDESLFNEDQRKRSPEIIDRVGQELERLYTDNKNVKGLKTYLGLWHKMRARIFIQKHHRWCALRECVKSIQYNISVKIIIFMLLAFLPYSVSNYIFHKLG